MASPKTIVFLDKLIWVLIFGGLFLVALGIATHGEHLIYGWSLGLVGGVVAATGAVLIWVRSRMHEDPADGAKSDQH